MPKSIYTGARFVEKESEMSVVIREQTADHVVFSYEAYPDASHSFLRDAFIRNFSPLKAEEIITPREITLEKAEERAFEVEVVSRMLESYPHELQDSEISAVAGLLSRLSGEVVCYFIEEMAERRKAKEDKKP